MRLSFLIVLLPIFTYYSSVAVACDFPDTEPTQIKKLVINVLAQRLGLRPEDISLNSLTEPILHKPFGDTQGDCSGLWAMHHTLGYRFQLYEGSSCQVEGSAALLGRTYEAPIEVSFRMHCDNDEKKVANAKVN